MVERIRNAIMLKAEEFDADDLCCMGAPTSQHGRNVATALARAVVLAMREPTEAMLNAEHETGLGRVRLSESYSMEYSDASDVWRAMLAAALEEKP